VSLAHGDDPVRAASPDFHSTGPVERARDGRPRSINAWPARKTVTAREK
jgi:hypothetical protein